MADDMDRQDSMRFYRSTENRRSSSKMIPPAESSKTMVADTGSQRGFEDSIVLPDGRQLVTFRHAADYITSLPEQQIDLPDWQAAMQALLLVHESGPAMLARIAVIKAVDHLSYRAGAETNGTPCHDR